MSMLDRQASGESHSERGEKTPSCPYLSISSRKLPKAPHTPLDMGFGPLVKGCPLTRGIELVWGYAPSRSPRWTTPGGSATQRRYLHNHA